MDTHTKVCKIIGVGGCCSAVGVLYQLKDYATVKGLVSVHRAKLKMNDMI